jgi:probable F420-dependent oxidoreductase
MNNVEMLGRLGVWSWIDHMDGPSAATFARQLEAWGYGSLWVQEAVGRDPFVVLGYLAAQTERLVFATGIANIYARDAVAMKAASQTLAELSGGRFVLGLGASHAHLVGKFRGHVYEKPVAAMRAYLDAFAAARYITPGGEQPVPLLLAALRPAMLAVAKERALGAHPYLVPPEHTASARALLGPEAWLCPEQMLIWETDATRARELARMHLKAYIRLPNYQRNLRDFGLNDGDFDNGGSDRLVDSVIAWGDIDALRARIRAHYDAGANHVCIQPLRSDGQLGPDLALLEALAPAKHGLP